MKRAWIAAGPALLGAVLATIPLPALQAPTQKIDVSKLGPKVGQRVPDFLLKDQFGNARNLKSVMGPKGAMLVFIRSADW